MPAEVAGAGASALLMSRRIEVVVCSDAFVRAEFHSPGSRPGSRDVCRHGWVSAIGRGRDSIGGRDASRQRIRRSGGRRRPAGSGDRADGRPPGAASSRDRGGADAPLMRSRAGGVGRRRPRTRTAAASWTGPTSSTSTAGRSVSSPRRAARRARCTGPRGDDSRRPAAVGRAGVAAAGGRPGRAAAVPDALRGGGAAPVGLCEQRLHDDACLLPLLEQQEQVLERDRAAAGAVAIDPDCDAGKHYSCVGCPCTCHRTPA